MQGKLLTKNSLAFARNFIIFTMTEGRCPDENRSCSTSYFDYEWIENKQDL